MFFKVCTWNVNGLSDFAKTRQVVGRIRDLKADVIVIQEVYKNVSNLTPNDISKKIEEISKNVQMIWNSDFWLSNDGKIGIFSNFRHSIAITNSYCQGRVVDFTFTHLARGDRKIRIPYFTTNFRAVYAPANSSEKPQFWRDFPDLEPLQWILGDFNMAWSKKDRSGRTTSDNPGRMKEILSNHIDCHYELRNRNPECTFHKDSRIPFRSSKSRIDYIFAPEGQLSPYAEIYVEDGGTSSDHSILILNNTERRRRKAEWRMNIRNLDDENIFRTTEEAILRPRSIAKWDDLKTEIRNIHKEIGVRKASILKENIFNLTRRLAKLRRESSDQEKIARVKNALALIETQYAERLAVKSGTQWLEEGERSTKYFYRRFRERLQTARIQSLSGDNGEVWTTAEEKADAARGHLQRIWDRTDVKDPNTFKWYCPTLSKDKAKSVIERISVEEVLQTISGLANSKAPGPDGIPSEFYKKHQEHLAPKLAALFNEILLNDKVAPLTWSESRCVLIPKKTEHIDKLANWRPITLENCDLKIFSKILSDRLQKVVTDLVGEGQTGFIAGRSIHESVLTIDAALDTSNPDSYILSLDWSKAYDRVNHNWLTHCLKEFGLPQQFVNTIRNLFYSRTATVAVDDVSRIVECRQGVPQGDPIAPLLFVLALEPLMAKVRNEIKGIQTPKGEVSYVAFADDSTFMIQDKQNLKDLVNILNEYTEMSGAVVNWSKSALTPLSNTPPATDTPFTLTAIKKPPPTLGFSYPLDENTSNNIWENLITKIEKSLRALGQRKSLTIAGRALVARSMALSKAWYISKVLTPTEAQENQLTSIVWLYISGKGSIHPPRDIAILCKENGGIAGPDIGLEFKTYAAQLFYNAIRNINKPWAYHVLSALPRQTRKKPQDLILHFMEEARQLTYPSKRYKSPTVARALKSWKVIDANSSGQIEAGWTHRKIRKLIQPIKSTIPFGRTIWTPEKQDRIKFRWKELWGKYIPPKIRDILWRAAFNALPTRMRIRHVSNIQANCDLCHTPEDSRHMIRGCAYLQHFWGCVAQLAYERDDELTNLLYGIAYQAVYNENMHHRINDTPRILANLYFRYRGLLEYYRKRIPSLQSRWPSKNDVHERIAYDGLEIPFYPHVSIIRPSPQG
jgi:exonuclease III